MHRRNFIRLSALGAASGIIAPKAVLASVSNMAGGVYYTREAPGRWSKKIDGHMPVIEVSGKDVQVTTPHEMKDYEHYIVKHILLNDNFKFMDEMIFDPLKIALPISKFSLKDYSGRIHVLSVCNKHDTWMNIAEL